MKKIWQKNITPTERVESFTVGRDRELDNLLAEADVLGSLAHTRMLETIGLLSSAELSDVQRELKLLLAEAREGRLTVCDQVEDIHSQVEGLLTQKIGDTGKKIHSGRSRNDQVLLDLRIYMRREIYNITALVEELFGTLIALSEKHKAVLMPGYTHLQVAMPSSFGLWFGAYAESLADDLQMLRAAYDIINRNPLGSAAGYGSSFPLDRQMTSDLLGFASPVYNVVYAQMGRGKSERLLAQAIASIASTLGRLATDNTLFLSQNFAFISYPPELTTGSSIMPHKKNPDVWEIMRGKCNLLQGVPNQVTLLTTNLPLGYNRDLQLLKETIFPAIEEVKLCLSMAKYMLESVSVREGILEEEKYTYIFSVETVNDLVLSGVPFREAYVKVGLDIEKGGFAPRRTVNHTHLGSIGNLANKEIANYFQKVVDSFGFKAFLEAEENLSK